MPVLKSPEEIEFLKRVDEAYRRGESQEAIARSEKLTSPTGVANKVARLGFRFTRIGGLRLTDTMLGRDFAEWLSSGELAAAPEERAVAAV